MSRNRGFGYRTGLHVIRIFKANASVYSVILVTFDHFIFNALVGYPTFDISLIEITHIVVVVAYKSSLYAFAAKTTINRIISAAVAAVIGETIFLYFGGKHMIIPIISVNANRFTAYIAYFSTGYPVSARFAVENVLVMSVFIICLII